MENNKRCEIVNPTLFPQYYSTYDTSTYYAQRNKFNIIIYV